MGGSAPTIFTHFGLVLPSVQTVQGGALPVGIREK